jgi:hypothetical protein
MSIMAKGLWPIAFTALAHAPARYAMASRERLFGHDFVPTFSLAMLVDIACLGPILAALLTPFDWLAAKRGSGPRSILLAKVGAVATLAVSTSSFWMVSVAATEFRIQRGIYPTLFESLQGLRDVDFIRGSAQIAWFERYSWPSLAALLCILTCIPGYVRIVFDARRAPSVRGAKPPLAALGSVVWAVLAAAVFLVWQRAAPLSNMAPLASPLVRLVAEAGSADRVTHGGGVRGALASTSFDESELRRGIQLLGFGNRQADCLLMREAGPECTHHPLARPLPGDTERPHRDARLGSSPPSLAGLGRPSPLVEGLLSLSAALFEDRPTPLTVWHIALESFRADDINALNAAASKEITPFVNAVYASSEALEPQTISFRHTYQSGLRTAQAISGLWCGLGALPFQLALSRDLLELPVKCAPDVLQNAGFQAQLYYGSNASFEHLDEFARAHGLVVHDISTLPPDLPRGAFRAVTDAALLRVARSEAHQAGPLAYNFVLTLSGHTPFDLPEDLAALTRSRVGNAISQTRQGKVSEEDLRRLLTIAYTDDALEAFVREVERSPEANQSILIVSADHATSDPPLWGNATSEAMAKVPLFIYLPSALIAAARDPTRVQQALRAMATLSANTAVSLNDVPALLLSLLARHPALDQLPPELRWHTLGGSPTADSSSSATSVEQVWGIDASSRVFLIPRNAVHGLVDTGERSVAFSVWNEPLGPLLKDVTAALSAILGMCIGPSAAATVETHECAPSRGPPHH